MSQAKVDAYKERKKNRKKIEAHEKRMAWLRGIIALLVLALIIAWAGYSGYVKHMDNLPHKTAEVDYTAITDYATDISNTDAEETTEETDGEDTSESESTEETEETGETAETTEEDAAEEASGE